MALERSQHLVKRNMSVWEVGVRRDGYRMQVQIVCSRHRVSIRAPVSAEYSPHLGKYKANSSAER